MAVVLVTGGTGFIGRRLVARLLHDGHAVRVLSRRIPQAPLPPSVEVVAGDIRNRDVLARACAGMADVFHLAARVHETTERRDRGDHAAVTVDGTRLLMQAAGEAGVRRMVFCSSLAVFGRVDSGVHDESTPARPTSAYGRAKLEAEGLVLDQAERFSMHAACIRPAMVYSPGCRGNLPRLIRLLDRGLCPQVPDVGTRRSVAHLDDVVAALMLMMERPEAKGRIYIVADREAYTLREMIAIICQALGRRPPRWTVPLWCLRSAAAAGDALSGLLGCRVVFDSEELDKLVGAAWFTAARLERDLNYQPQMTFAAAMPEVVAAWRASGC
jgi:nucleoside-diphosphate-sugar epimerase